MLDQANLPETTAAQLQALIDMLRESLDGSLLGILLHGSATTSGFDVERSDLDVLTIIDDQLTPQQCEAIGKGLLMVSNAPHPIEISVVAQQDLDDWSHPCKHQLHYGEDLRYQFTRNCFMPEMEEDEDLAMHVTLARARGIDLLGGYPVERLPLVPRQDYLSAIVRDFHWAAKQDEDLGQYALANACRTLAYLRSDSLLSKSEGLEWCQANAIDTSNIVEDVTAQVRSELSQYRAS